ncbi:MAG TPA: ATP synthase F1 subunit gamma [Thermoanaerobaculia bacterium]
MASLIDIRRRLRSVTSTQQITRAMKMVAAAKLRRAQERVIGARPYAKLITSMLASVQEHARGLAHPLLEVREETKVLVVVVAGDRGLCGAFNTNVHRATAHLISQHPEWKEIRLLPIGKKAIEYWRRRTYPLAEKSFPDVLANVSFAKAREVANFVAEEFLSGRVDAVYVVVNVFRSVISQVVHIQKLLPLAPEVTPEGKPSAEAKTGSEAPAKSASLEYLYEPDVASILAWLLPRYLEFMVYRALAESAAAEMGARMTAMDAATKNAGEMIDRLTLTYNRARQARITKELIEIVSGAAALE